jgi:hypothetical protein
MAKVLLLWYPVLKLNQGLLNPNLMGLKEEGFRV